MEHVPLLVLGAGIDGLAASLCLAHQGFPVELLDRGPDPESLDDAGPSGSMVLRPSAARVLHGLGLLDTLRPRALEVQRYTHLDAGSGQPLRKVELGDVARARFGYPCLIVARRDLRRALAQACAADEMIGVHYECRPTAVEDIGDAALVTLDGGTSWRAEALVGADGSSSRVRGLLEAGAGALSPTFVVRRTTVAVERGRTVEPGDAGVVGPAAAGDAPADSPRWRRGRPHHAGRPAPRRAGVGRLPARARAAPGRERRRGP